VAGDPNIEQEQQEELGEGNSHEPANPGTTKLLSLLKIHHRRESKQSPNSKVAKNPPTNQPRWQSIHPKRSTTSSTTAAKHPPEKRSGKVSAKRQLAQKQLGRGGRDKAKPGTEAGALRGEPTTTTRTRRHRFHRQPAWLPRRRLQRWSDATGAVVVRPTWSMFSPEEHTGEEGNGERMMPSRR